MSAVHLTLTEVVKPGDTISLNGDDSFRTPMTLSDFAVTIGGAMIAVGSDIEGNAVWGYVNPDHLCVKIRGTWYGWEQVAKFRG